MASFGEVSGELYSPDSTTADDDDVRADYISKGGVVYPSFTTDAAPEGEAGEGGDTTAQHEAASTSSIELAPSSTTASAPLVVLLRTLWSQGLWRTMTATGPRVRRRPGRRCIES